MSRRILFSLFLPVMVLSTILTSCKKNSQTPDAYYGYWQWIGSSWGPSQTTPSPDSTVVLILIRGNFYQTTLNGQLSSQGTFQLENNSNRNILHFNDINQPFGNATTVTSGNVTLLSFNYSQIGQLTLFEDNWTDTPGNTLQLIQYPTGPEATVNHFKRIPGPP